MVPKALNALVCVALVAPLSGCAPLQNNTRPPRPGAQSASAEPTSTESPGSGTPQAMRFAVLGDLGTGLEEQYAVADRMCRWWRNHPFDVVFTTGDNVYNDGHPDDFEAKFFDPYACLFDRGVRFRASLGNHDIHTDNGRPELEEPAFGMRGRNYVIRRGGVRFVVADSNKLRKRWLRSALVPKDGDRWTVVVFHHPVYSPGAHGSTPGFAPELPRMFRRKGVDLVLNGHDHLYFVSKPLKRIRYVVTGGGGARLYLCHSRWFTAVCRRKHHFLYVVAKPDRIVVMAVPRNGPPFHRFSTRGRQ